MLAAHIIKITRVAGAEQHLLTLLPGLQVQGIVIRLLLLVEPDNPMDDYAHMMSERGIQVERVIINGDADFSLHRRSINLLRGWKPDIVHTHLLHADVYGIPAARLAGVRAIITSRHNENAFRRRFPIKQINQVLWRWASAGIAISESVRRFSIEVEGAAPDKVQRIYYGLEQASSKIDRKSARNKLHNELGLAGDAALIGMVCRLTEQKGVEYGIRAFGRVAGRFPNTHVVIAGEGHLRQALEAEVQNLGLSGRVQFLGWRDDVREVMAALDVLLVPSLWEGFGLVMLEAMAAGVAVVGTSVSSIPEIIEDFVTGRLVPPRDVEAMAGVLSGLLADPALRQHMGLLGQDRLENLFSAGRMIEETTALYGRLT